MSYKIEKTEIGQDVVISGWEEGTQDDPYKGIYDMRNCDAVTIPGEVSVAMSTIPTFTQIAITNVTVTVVNATSVFTYNGTIPLTINTPITFTNSGGALPAGLVNTATYYILTTPSPTTFTISLLIGGAQKLVTDNGSGTNTFSVINMGTPTEIIGPGTLVDDYYSVDSNGRVWGYFAGYINSWVYLNNLASELIPIYPNNIIVWKGYLFLFTSFGVTQQLGYWKIDPATIGLKSSWVLNWQSIVTSISHKALIGQDDVVYFCDGSSVGSIKENLGKTFDPTDATTYTYSANALAILSEDIAMCLAELGSSLMIGGQNNLIYPWDRVSLGYSSVIRLSENYISRMVTINTTMYIFCGYKGRIFVTNGANATPFYKIPEYLSETTNSYIIWTDANFNRNQLYFGFTVTKNSGTTISTMGGLWAIDVDSVTPVAPRLQNIMSYGTYAGYVSAICQFRGSNKTNNPSNDGYGLFMGWYDGVSTGGIDKGISAPYTAGQSYIDTDPIPVGQYLTNKTLTGIEYKLAQPLAANETVTISYRTQMSGSYTDNPMTDLSTLSGWGRPIFEKSQWVQLRVILTSTATDPSYCRIREVRLHLT